MFSMENFLFSRINIIVVYVDIVVEIIKLKKECVCI